MLNTIQKNLSIRRLHISKWASNHIFTARLLLTFTEISRLSVAFFLGKQLLPFFDINNFSLLTILVISLAYMLLNLKESKISHKKYGLILLSCSFLLFFNTGSLFSENVDHTNSSSIMANSKKEEIKKGLVQRTLDSNKPLIKLHKSKLERKPISKFWFVALFALSLVLTWLGLVLGCTLSCNGFAIFAWMAIIGSFGVLAGGLFFLLKAISKRPRKKHGDLTKEERWRNWKKFLMLWGIVTATAFLTLLLINL
jgi:hypothetical protein